MTFELVPRDLIFAGMYPPGHVPDYSSGAARLRLVDMPGLAVHYTGVDGFADSGDTIAEIRAIQRNARDSGRYGTGWEYGYVIPFDDDDLVYEYAGDYLAYHIRQIDPATGRTYNYSRASVLILCGPNDRPVPNRVVDKVRWLYAKLVEWNVLQTGAAIQGHRDLVSTSCPGDHVYNRLPDMRIPWVEPPDGKDFLTMEQFEAIMAELDRLDDRNRDRYADLKDRQSQILAELGLAQDRYADLKDRQGKILAQLELARPRYADLKDRQNAILAELAAIDATLADCCPPVVDSGPPPTPS